MKRCEWVNNKPDLYLKYHDEEWGTPIYNDEKLFEMLLLECFQAGLSWFTILKKRESFRLYFDNFDPIKISQYNEDKIDDLMTHKEIIRNKSKINAAINNTIIFLDIQKEYGSFSDYLWGFTKNKIILNITNEFVTTSDLSDKVSKDLKKRGMKFVGSITIYSYLQAIGIINDHDTECFKYKKLI
jgi:DNA-3-methyladenine glycosylase I